MLFTGATITGGRVQVAVGGTVVSFNSGFGYDTDGLLVLDAVSDPDAFVKGIGVTTDGAVCATTATDGEAYVEGVRVSDAGKLVYEDAASTGVTSGNPVTATGALACET